jgi:protein-tyrosine-phosphatase/DNA-binding transcriptional ArsR family regulator
MFDQQSLTQLKLTVLCDVDTNRVARAAKYSALGDPARLAIVDELVLSDRAPVELRRLLGIESNLLSHHLDVLEHVGMICRSASSGDGRRRYVHLVRESLHDLMPGQRIRPQRVLFVCTRNSARSQLAAALWRSIAGAPAESAGTHPADRVHPRAVAAAKRAGFDIAGSTPQMLDHVAILPDIVVTVCDQAHEELDPDDQWLHWSVPDPVAVGTKLAFDDVVTELRERITALLGDMRAAAWATRSIPPTSSSPNRLRLARGSSASTSPGGW